MKKYLSLILIFCVAFESKAQPFDQYTKQWATYFGGQGTRFTSSFIDGEGNIVAVAEITGGLSPVLNDSAYYNQFVTSSLPEFLYNSSMVTSGYSHQTLIAKFDTNGVLLQSAYLPFYPVVAKNDDDDNIYIAGLTTLNNIGTANAWQSNPLPVYQTQSEKGIMVKLNPDFSINWLTYTPTESSVWGFCFDESFNIYGIAHTQVQSGITTQDVFQPDFIYEANGNTYYRNGYLFKLNNQGQLQWATYYGLTYGYAIDYKRGELITSFSRYASSLSQYDSYYYTSNAYSQSPSSQVISKFNAATGQRTYSTYLGTGVTGIANDGVNYYFYGWGGAVSSGLIGPNAYQANVNGLTDFYLGKFDPNINPIWGTYIGGTDMELINPYNNVSFKDSAIYIVGYSGSNWNINSPNPYQNNNAGIGDLITMKFDTSGSFVWGTFFGGGWR
ncbi:MAG: hypothetical protein QM642_05070 [Edaphocola sp.]